MCSSAYTQHRSRWGSFLSQLLRISEVRERVLSEDLRSDNPDLASESRDMPWDASVLAAGPGGAPPSLRPGMGRPLSSRKSARLFHAQGHTALRSQCKVFARTS